MTDDGLDHARRAAGWAGMTLNLHQEALLVRYAEWLSAEAVAAGGLGPEEGGRIWSRHIADSLTFAAGWRGCGHRETLLDLGSGAGLPGIPLAITHPETAVTLLDRSERRVALTRRAIRIIGLDNAKTRIGDVERHAGTYAAVTMRAVIPLPVALDVVRRCLAPGGVGVIGASRTGPPPVPSPLVTTLEIPAWVLDSPAWLLRMTCPTE
jgi:16S rRNA (guanine527-N7)-methyltransferase